MEETTMKETELTEAIEKPYTLKKLCADNVFAFCTILNRIGFKELKGCFQNEEIKAIMAEKDDNKIEKVGLSVMMDIASIVLSNLDNCKENIYKILSDLSGMKKDEIASLDMDVFINMIIDVFKKEEFKDFFKAVSKLLK